MLTPLRSSTPAPDLTKSVPEMVAAMVPDWAVSWPVVRVPGLKDEDWIVPPLRVMALARVKSPRSRVALALTAIAPEPKAPRLPAVTVVPLMVVPPE